MMPPTAKRGVRPKDLYLLRTVVDPQVSPDGKRVAYVVTWPDRDADETRMSVYIAPLDGRAPARRFTQGNKDHTPRWSPDGRHLAFVSDRGEKNQLFVAPLDGGEARQVTKTKHGISNPGWSPDGKLIAYMARTGDYKTPKERSPVEKSAPRVIRNLRYKLDGIGFFDERRTHIFTIDVESGEEKQITDGDRYDDQPAWSPNGKTIAFVSDRETQRHQRQWRSDIWAVPAKGGRPRKLTRSRGAAVSPTFSPDRRRAAFTAVWLTQPHELYAASLNSRSREVNLSHANDELRASFDTGRLERMTYNSQDGLEIEGFVLYPPNYKRGRSYPLAVNVHGGPHSFHPGSRAWIEFHSLAAAGYVVLLPNPRGSTTYGEAFSEAVVRDWGGRDCGDIMAGVDELVGRGVADPGQLYIGGYSYGGFMSPWAVGHSDRFRAAVVGAPVSNQESMFGTGDIPLFDMHEIGGTPLDDPDEYRRRSPVTFLANVNTPVLLLHHEGDLRCPIGQSEEIFHALKVLGREVEFIRYPGGFHTTNTQAPSQIVDHARRMVAWYESHAPPRRAKRGKQRRQRVKVGV